MSTLSPAPAPNPRDLLLGKAIKDGWVLSERLDKKAGDSGGTFGTGYIAKRGPGEVAFVKAIDYVAAFNSSNIATELLRITREFEFERELMEYCTNTGMSKVVRFYGHDEVSADGSGNPLMKVSCLIMEAGDKDLRRLVNTSGAGSKAGCAWNLFILSDVALAVAQLHRGGVAHHDVKPSNVIATSAGTKPDGRESAAAPGGGMAQRQQVKVADLGRALRRDKAGPFDGLHFAGDRRYQPLECYYRHQPPDWVDSRDAGDAYMVGSLAVYLFTGVSLQELLFRYVPDAFLPTNWRGAYEQALLMVLQDATARVLLDHLRPTLPADQADEIIAVTKSLIHPDPKQRGDRKARREVARLVGMDRVQQRLHLMALRCAASERGRAMRS